MSVECDPATDGFETAIGLHFGSVRKITSGKTSLNLFDRHWGSSLLPGRKRFVNLDSEALQVSLQLCPDAHSLGHRLVI